MKFVFIGLLFIVSGICMLKAKKSSLAIYREQRDFTSTPEPEGLIRKRDRQNQFLLFKNMHRVIYTMIFVWK